MHSSQRDAGNTSCLRAHPLRFGARNVARAVLVSWLAGGLLGATATAQYHSTLAATPTARLAQPQLLEPIRTYPPPYPTTNAAILQPPYLTPVSELPASYRLEPKPLRFAPVPARPIPAPAVASPIPATLAPTQVSTPPARANVEASPAQPRAKFWQFVLGPTAAPQSQVPPPRPTTSAKASSNLPSAAPNSTSITSSSLIRQFLGTNSPPPQPAASTKRNLPLLTDPFLLVAAEEPTAPSQRRPTVQDIEAAKTPATSVTIGSAGLPRAFPPSSASLYQSPQPAPNSLGIPSVPTVPGLSSQNTSAVAAALWRPFTMTNDEPVAAMPTGPNVRATNDNQRQRPEQEPIAGLLQPFYATNQPAAGTSRQNSQAGRADEQVPQSLAEALSETSLARQLSMLSYEDRRTAAVAAIEAETRRDQQPWDGTVTVQWPLMANPFTMTETVEAVASVPERGIQNAAFLQEPLPVPDTQSSTEGDLGLPGDLDRSEDTGANRADDTSHVAGDEREKDKQKTLVGAETLGDAPDDSTLDFLRTQTVLLNPGKHQFDIGFSYVLSENEFPVLVSDGMGNIIGVDDVEIKIRELTVPMELRYGLLPRVQGFLQVPVGWANVHAAVDNFEEFQNDGGIGDIGFGLTAQLRNAEKDKPYLIGTLAGLAPSGGDPFSAVGIISPNSPSLGNGFWAVSGSLLWVQTRYDPVVVFYGFGARYQFEHRYRGIEFEPGTEYNYTLGTGFAVNERVTLSAQFFGAYIEEIKANGERVRGTSQEPMNLRLAATLAKPKNRLVEPFLIFGLTDDAIAANFGITWTY